MCTAATAAAGSMNHLRFPLCQGLVFVWLEFRSQVLAMPGGLYFVGVIFDTKFNMPSLNLVKACT
jgi:hypothetical protein